MELSETKFKVTHYQLAARIDEMCWHLIKWGEAVTIEQPAKLRQRLAHMCASLVAHHAD